MNKNIRKAGSLLLIDLDDTLIDSSSFKRSLFQSLSNKSRLPKVQIINIYSSLKNSHVLTPHWPEKMADIIAKECEIDPKILLRIMYDQIKCFKIVKPVLNSVIRFSGTKIIFTTGDLKFQQSKIDYLHLNNYVDKVIIKTKDKYLYLHKRIHGNTLTINNCIYNQVTIIDDRAPLITNFKKYSWVTIIDPLNIINP